MAVPEIIQKDLYQSACRFLEGVYPDIDKDWMRKECGKALLKDRYGLLRLHRAIWPAMVPVLNTDTFKMDMAFPWCDVVEIEALRPPPGVSPEKLEKPLTLAEAEVRARRVLAVMTGGPDRARRFEATVSGGRRAGYDYFIFEEFANPPGRYALAHACIDIRRSDGFVQRCEWSAERLRPKISYEKAAEMAKAAGRKGNRDDDIRLAPYYNGGKETLLWAFCTPPPPGGGMPQDDTSWDAMTGELVFSMMLHGGTPQKPYYNAKYTAEIKDETKDDVIQRNLEKVIRQRVAELEEKERNRKPGDLRAEAVNAGTVPPDFPGHQVLGDTDMGSGRKGSEFGAALIEKQVPLTPAQKSRIIEILEVDRKFREGLSAQFWRDFARPQTR